MQIFAIVSCVRESQTPRLFTHFLPSLQKTISSGERATWHIRLYLCSDVGDSMYSNMSSSSITLRDIEVRRVVWTRRSIIPHGMTAELAFAEGASYVHRTNDDTEYLTKEWLTLAVQTISRFGRNIGVVGPKVWGDGFRPGLLTLDCVHRQHLSIFSHYYPRALSNWYIDDWISAVYSNRSVRLRRWQTRHVFIKRRYRVKYDQRHLLPGLIACGRRAVHKYIEGSSQVAIACGGVHEDMLPKLVRVF